MTDRHIPPMLSSSPPPLTEVFHELEDDSENEPYLLTGFDQMNLDESEKDFQDPSSARDASGPTTVKASSHHFSSVKAAFPGPDISTRNGITNHSWDSIRDCSHESDPQNAPRDVKLLNKPCDYINSPNSRESLHDLSNNVNPVHNSSETVEKSDVNHPAEDLDSVISSAAVVHYAGTINDTSENLTDLKPSEMLSAKGIPALCRPPTETLNSLASLNDPVSPELNGDEDEFDRNTLNVENQACSESLLDASKETLSSSGVSEEEWTWTDPMDQAICNGSFPDGLLLPQDLHLQDLQLHVCDSGAYNDQKPTESATIVSSVSAKAVTLTVGGSEHLAKTQKGFSNAVHHQSATSGDILTPAEDDWAEFSEYSSSEVVDNSSTIYYDSGVAPPLEDAADHEFLTPDSISDSFESVLKDSFEVSFPENFGDCNRNLYSVNLDEAKDPVSNSRELWMALRNLEDTNAMGFLWASSTIRKILLRSLNLSLNSPFEMQKKNPVPLNSDRKAGDLLIPTKVDWIHGQRSEKSTEKASAVMETNDVAATPTENLDYLNHIPVPLNSKPISDQSPAEMQQNLTSKAAASSAQSQISRDAEVQAILNRLRNLDFMQSTVLSPPADSKKISKF